MDPDEQGMLYEGTSTHVSPHELLTDAANAFWTITDEDQQWELSEADHFSLSDPPVTCSTSSTNFESPWSEEDLFAAANGSPAQELRVSDVPLPAAHINHKERVISRIESVFESMFDVLLNKEDSFALFLKTRPSSSNTSPTFGKIIRFPGKTTEEAWRFTVLVRMLEIIHEALITDRVVSKRELYYRHPALFTKQMIVDQYVDDIAYTFGTTRSNLNVCAAEKGLVSGAVTILKNNSTIAQKLDGSTGHLIPDLDSGYTIHTNVRWIIVVEKEAIFRSISASTAWEFLRHQGVMVTGKGYPDLSTRKFLHHLSSASAVGTPRIPVYALVDYDPDGLSIMCTYKYGSSPLAHEGNPAQVRHLQWIGIKSAQAFPVECSNSINSSVHQSEGLIELSYRDRRRATNMLCEDYCAEDGSNDRLRRELQVMLMLNLKAEIELLESRNDGVAGWLMEQLTD